QQHLHADDVSADCVVCLQSDHAPLLRVAVAAASFVAGSSHCVVREARSSASARCAASYLSRAPPQA
ncbi:MAG: hypothetical protein AB8B93_20705, partial [Pseudomonadales bacterium]